MFHESNLSQFYPSVANASQDQLNNLQYYQPKPDVMRNLWRSISGSTRSMVDLFHAAGLAYTAAKSGIYKGEDYKQILKPDIKDIAKTNVTTALTTQGTPIANFVGSAVPFIATSFLTDGLGGLVTSAAENLSARAAFNAAANEVEPMSVAASQQASKFGIKKAIKLAGKGAVENSPWAATFSLGLDEKGNVKLDTKALLENETLGAVIPLVLHGAESGYRSLSKARLTDKKIVSEPEKPLEKEDIKQIYEESKSPIGDLDQTHDIEMPDSIVQSTDFKLSDLSDMNYLHSSAKVVQDLVDDGVKINGQHFDIKDSNMRQMVDDTLDTMEDMKLKRGSRKVALTKMILDNPEQAKKWDDILNKADKTPYRSTGAIKEDTGEFFYQFNPKSYHPNDFKALNEASKKGDDTATAILALKNLSASRNFDAKLSTLKALRHNIILHDNGILDLVKNYGKDTKKRVNDFINDVYSKYADYFTNPLSSGYLKLSRNFKAFGELVNCLIGTL